MAGAGALSIAKLTKVYPGGVHALRGADLEVAAGELVAIVGPSACGKTTLLRLVAGLERPTSGTMLIGGADAAGLTPRERDVAMVFQEDALYPHLTVRGNLELRGRIRSARAEAIRSRVGAASELLRLGPLLDRYPGSLSGGERRRVALGRAVASGAAIILLDEPFSGLDAALRVELRAELRAARQRLVWTGLLVTHDEEDATELADRVVRMGGLSPKGTVPFRS
jgi:sn-glycerol 3-phosphate transport system ATP-binding protein